MNRHCRLGLAFLVAAVLGGVGAADVRAQAQGEAQAQTGGEPAPDLYSLELIGTPDLRRFGGVAELVPVASPFTAPVTAGGVHRWRVRVVVDSLPDPRRLGDYDTFVVWAAPPTMRPMVRLGELHRTGDTPAATMLTGEVAFDRFTLFVTAEADANVDAPSGPYVLRGLSPSMRMGAAHMVQASSSSDDAHAHHASMNGWTMPEPHPEASMMYMPGLAGMVPNATPYLPGAGVDPATVPLARPRELLEPADGDTIRLEAGLVRRTVRGRDLLMYAFNGQQPGPLVHVRAGGTVHVNFVNRTELPTAVHWHGIRLDNRFDGVPHVTQEPVAPGDSFHYEVRFPDAGVYWYHPHHREDIQQDLGLYGNLLVRNAHPDAFGPAHREQVLMLDDLLLGDAGLVPYGEERATHALMGRFGNVLLVNGEPAPSYSMDVKQGAVVRFFFTNVANTRTFNVSFPGARMKVVGSDIGRYEQEAWVESVVIAPAERYIVDVAFDSAGTTPLVNRVQAIDHTFGVFFAEADTLGVVRVAAEPATPDYASGFDRLRRNEDVVDDIARYSKHFTRAPDLTLT
ncbi:MAG: multicopper oxidase family protein, partial [Longimicrobiales bacterium]